MNQFLAGVGFAIVLSTSAFAAKKTPHDDLNSYQVPVLEEVAFEDDEYIKIKKEWNQAKRKLASDASVDESQMSKDLKRLRDEWLNVKSGNEMEALLQKAMANYASFSPDTQYFLAQMQTALPLRGIIWRMRALFENSKGFLGNKSTHVSAVQAVRGAVTSLKMFLPTQQTDAAIQYFTEPSVEMSTANQFKSVAEFQKFLLENFLPVVKDSIAKIQVVYKANPQRIYVWDNKMAFGKGTFEDEIQRFIGHGPAEVNFTISTMYRGFHNIKVFCAYNQDAAIKVAGQLGGHVGLDSYGSSKKEDFGLTDEERVSTVKAATVSSKFLELRDYNGPFGTNLMKDALVALRNSVSYASRAYGFLDKRDSSRAMSINPLLFQEENSPNIKEGISNMKALVTGVAEVRDHVSGSAVTINVPAFYQNPPKNLNVLMATAFETGAAEKTIVAKNGEKLAVRNYLRGRSIAWDNNQWKQFVPSAAGKGPGYMSEAKRIISYSFGTSMVFGLPDMFVH